MPIIARMAFLSGRPRWRVLVVAGSAIVAAGCGSPDAAGAPNGSATETDVAAGDVAQAPVPVAPVVTEAAPATPAPTSAPSEVRILPLDGDLAEVVFALGLGDQVVATDISATYPPEADALPEIGYQRSLAAEPIAAFEPTIVLATDIAGPPEVLDELERLGFTVVMIPTESTPDGPGIKIRAVADALGVPDRGETLAAEVDAAIAAAMQRAETAPTAPRVGVLYLRGSNVQLLFGEGTDVDWIVDAVGAVSIADELGVVDAAPINAEALVLAAPDVLIVPERGLESVGGVDGLLELPGIAATPAGAARRVLTYDDQLLLGNGPRTGALLDQLITDLHGGTTE
jgi:iron complex transport system substrate-binding protein